MLKEETIEFLRDIHPFSFLSGAEIESIVEDIRLEFYPRGVRILVQDGPPSEYLYVIKKGGVKVYVESEADGETVIDFRSEGEPFGLLSLVSGDKSRASVLAVEDTISYLIPKGKILPILEGNPAAGQYFLKSFFINFIDKTYDETRRKYTAIADNERLLYTTPVAELMHREPVTTPRRTSIQDAATEMVRQKISSIVVVDDDGTPLGMVTDRDFREKVVAGGASLGAPVGSIMSASLVTVDADEYCFEALLRMMRHNIHHVLVMDNGRLRGMLTNHDFMVLQGASPTVLVKEIEKARSVDDLATTVPKLCKATAVLLREGAKAHNITGFITELVDKVINGVVDLVERRTGVAPLPYTLFLLGQGGRRELTLDLKINLGIVYGDADDPGAAEAAGAYFSQFINEVNEALDACCHMACHDRCLALERVRSFSGWKEHFRNWGRPPDYRIPQAEYCDMRPVRGEADPVLRLRDFLLERAAQSRDFVGLLTADMIQNRPPLGFFKKFVVDKAGEHKNELDLYGKGIKPLVDSVRIVTLARGGRGLSTMKRLHKLKAPPAYGQAEDIERVVDYLLALLIHNQLQQIDEGLLPDTYINPDSLSELEKKTLKESFLLTAALYDGIEKSYRTV